MDCFYHSNVPSVARCGECRRPICSTCRDAEGSCPGCRLGARVTPAHALRGGIRRRSTALATPVESRALAALGYPFWPLALLALLDSRKTPYLRRQAYQGLLFNFGFVGFAWIMHAAATIPLLGLSAWALIPFLIPLWLVASIVYAVKTFHGDEVHVPFVSDWLDQRLPA